MREYGQIQSAYWTHPDIHPLSVETKALGAYLLTCQHTNGIGCFRLPAGYAAIDLNIPIETVSKGFQELSQAGFLLRDERSEYLLLPAFLRWNPVSNPNAAKARVKEFDVIPSSIEIYASIIKALQKNGKYWSDEFETLLVTLSERFQNPSERVLEDVRDKRPDQTRPDQDQTPLLVGKAEDDGEEGSTGEKQTADRIPVQAVVDLYHQLLPELPKCIKITDKRRAQIKQRWRDDLPELSHWENYFAYVKTRDFLMGRCAPGAGRSSPFLADLEWLTNQSNFVKVAEKKYQNANESGGAR